MRFLFLLIVFGLVFFSVGVFSADAVLVKYSSVDVTSHACLPSSPLCNYPVSVLVDESNIVPCSDLSAYHILGLSDVTNAHVGLPGNGNYPSANDICMKGSLFSAPVACKFSALNEDCQTALPGSNCLFEISGLINAHLSSCNAFGINGVKFCCTFSASVGENGVCGSSHGQTFPFTETEVSAGLCSAGTPPASNPLFTASDEATWVCRGVPPTGVDSPPCSAFRSPQGVIPVDCNIEYFKAVSSFENGDTTFSYKCFTANNDVNLVVFDSVGNIVFPLSGLPLKLSGNASCGVAKKEFSFSSPVEVKQTYSARLFTSNACVREIFFSVKPVAPKPVPDSNFLTVFLVCIVVLGIFLFERKINK